MEKQLTIIDWLVVWNMNFMTFHNIWDVILPIDIHIFPVVKTTNQEKWWPIPISVHLGLMDYSGFMDFNGILIP